MTTKTRPTARMADQASPDMIVIERREVVAVITSHDEGDRSMFQVAFDAAGEYMASNAGGLTPLNLSWSIYGQRFTVGYEPADVEDADVV